MTIRITKPPQYIYKKYLSYLKNKNKNKNKISENILSEFFKTTKDFEKFKKYKDKILITELIFIINKTIEKNTYIEYISYKSKLKLLEDSIKFYYERMDRYRTIDQKDFIR